MKNLIFATAVLMLAACASSKHPTLNYNADKMSADTLCYHYAYARSNEIYKKEVEARHLDCDEIMESQAPVGESRY